MSGEGIVFQYLYLTNTYKPREYYLQYLKLMFASYQIPKTFLLTFKIYEISNKRLKVRIYFES